MESTVSYMSYFMSNTPSDITNEFFMKIPIYELLGSENTMVNEHINNHIMYYINNHFFSNNTITSYLINHPLYKKECYNKINEISNILADRFFELSEGKHFDMLSPEYENTVIKITYFEASNSYSYSPLSEKFQYSISNFSSKNKGLYCNTPGTVNLCENNRDSIASEIFCIINILVSMTDDIVYATRDKTIKNEVKIKLYTQTLNGTNEMLDPSAPERIETVIQIN